MAEDPRVGQTLDGKYRLDAVIGEGGMGTVYHATHLSLRAPRAVKVMKRELAADEAFVARFEKEARLAEGLRHPHLVTVYDLGRLPDGTPYIVNELVEGETLAQMLRRGLRFSPEEVAQLLGQIALGLEEAHKKGIVHRDIAPDNIMITGRGGAEPVARLLDFGIAKDLAATSTPGTASSLLLGKLGYSAPEQMGALPEGGSIDSRADVFSLSVVAFEMLTGDLPWRSESVQSYIHDLLVRSEDEVLERVWQRAPGSWHELLRQGLTRDRDRRTPDMKTLAAGMGAAAEAVRRQAAAPTLSDSNPPPARLGWSGYQLLAGLVAVVGAVVVSLWLAGRSDLEAPAGDSRASVTPSAPTSSPPPATPSPAPATSVPLRSPAPAPSTAASARQEEASSAVGLDKPAATPLATPRPTPRPTPTPTPSPEPTPVASGRLVVTSTPAASVSLDGEVRGRTPLTLDAVSPGEHELLLISDDGRSHRETVEIEPGRTLERDQRFAGFGSLSVTSAIWVEVQVDDAPPRQTPVRVPGLTVGSHIVRASRPGYGTQVIEVEIEEGQDARLVVELKKSP